MKVHHKNGADVDDKKWISIDGSTISVYEVNHAHSAKYFVIKDQMFTSISQKGQKILIKLHDSNQKFSDKKLE